MQRPLFALLALFLPWLPSAASQQPEAPTVVVEWTHDDKILLAASGLLATINLATGEQTLLDEVALTAALNLAGDWLAVAHADRVILRRYPRGGVRGVLRASQPSALAWSLDGATLAAGTEQGHVLLWEVASGALWADLEVAPPARVTRLAFAGNQRLLSAFADGRAVLWDLANREVLQRFDLAHNATGRLLRQAAIVALSPTGHYLLGTQIEQGKPEALLLDEAGGVVWRQPGYALEFSSDGNHVLALAPDSCNVLLLAAADGALEKSFTPPAEVTQLYFARLSPESTRLVAVGEDASGQILLLWDVATAQVLKTYR